MRHHGLFVRTRLLSLTVVVGFGFLLMVSLILDAGLTWVGTYLEASFSGVTVILQILNSAIAFGIAALLFCDDLQDPTGGPADLARCRHGSGDDGSPVHRPASS